MEEVEEHQDFQQLVVEPELILIKQHPNLLLRVKVLTEVVEMQVHEQAAVVVLEVQVQQEVQLEDLEVEPEDQVHFIPNLLL
jgi:hypothetical protein